MWRSWPRHAAEIDDRSRVRRCWRLACTPTLWSPERPDRYDVAPAMRQRPRARPGRPAPDRDAGRGDPAQRRAALSPRHLRARGGSGARPGHERGGHPPMLRGCPIARLQHAAARALPAPRARRLNSPTRWACCCGRKSRSIGRSRSQSADTFADAENQLLELIARDANRASVILWGVGNENADTDARYAFMARLARAARAADGTRLIAAACLINREHFRDRGPAGSTDLDVVGLNEYFGWYQAGYVAARGACSTTPAPGKPVVIGETGADGVAGSAWRRTPAVHRGVPGRHLPRPDRHGLAEAPYVRGFFPWLLYDYRTERRQTRNQRGISRKGLIADDKRTRKRAFAVLAAHYAKQAAEDCPS